MNGSKRGQNHLLPDWALLLGDLAAGAWLWFAFWGFTGQIEPDAAHMLVPAAVAAALALVLGLHRAGSGPLLRLAALGVSAAALAWGAGALKWLPVSGGQALWLGAATAIILGILRSFYWREAGSMGARVWEVARWIAVGLAATLVMLPFYFGGSLGSGDAHWYIVMLTDFLEQLKAGVFPIWVGQSPYAFNGAVSPLRFAPGFQHYGAVMDFLTAGALHPPAVKNLCLAASAVGGGFSAYACMRPIVGDRRWIACILAALWISGPGVLAPVMSGDQYMTFIAIPLVPVVLHGCWRLLEYDDTWGRFWIAAGLAGLWICHPPIGLWMTVIAGLTYAAALLARWSWRRELPGLAMMAAVFLALGSLPFVSVLFLDNQIHVPSSGLSAAIEIHRYFPGNFLPIAVVGSGLFDYQIGYALLGTLALALLAMGFSRPRASWAFALASLLIVPFTVPVPHVTDPLWGHLPSWFVTINNVWPMQRLFLIWSSLAAFTGAIVLGSPRISGSRLGYGIVAILLACGLPWSGREAHRLVAKLMRTQTSPGNTLVMEGPNNTELGRYAYGSFELPPAYANHSYMDAWFENRLLDRSTQEPFLTNADAAAPGDGPDLGSATLVSKGMMTAENIPNSTYYFLRPDLTLDPGKRYAIRLEFLQPGLGGTLQLTHETMFREYMLPDSGMGIGRNGPPKAFGTEPTSGRVLPLSVLGTKPAPIKALLITPRASHKDFQAARYWLYTYERSRLPIAVESWMPYTVRFNSPKAAYLESPRMWLRDWRATVNGRPVPAERSMQDLVMVPVEAGSNRVILEYRPPLLLRASFWIFLASWAALGAAAAAWLLSGVRSRPQA